MKLIFSTITALLSISAFGGQINAPRNWSGATLQVSQNIDAEQPRFTDPYTATVWGTLKTPTADLSDDEKRFVTYYEKNSFYSKKIPVYIKTQKQGNSPFTKNAPLMVVIPGIFGSAFNGKSLEYANKFYAQGYHVAIVSNPWGSDSILHQPHMLPGHVTEEGQAIYELIQSIVYKEISGKYVSSVNLYGESYGAFLTAVVGGLDDANNPLITGKMMLASPPVKMKTAYEHLDRMFKESVPTVSECESQRVGVALNIMRAHDQSGLKQSSIECSEFLVAQTFSSELADAMKQMQQAHLDVPAPCNATFQEYLDNFSPDLNTLSETTPNFDLKYWIGQAVLKGKTDISIVAASDDFLNNVGDWNEIEAVLPASKTSLVLLNWGGHLGYNGDAKLMKTVYANQASASAKIDAMSSANALSPSPFATTAIR